MSLHAIVNGAWQLFRDRELIAQATADADLLHIVELRRKDGSAINLAALLPDGWATNQDLSDPAKAMSAMAWRTDTYELVEAHGPLLLSRAGKGVRARYLSHVDLREKATGKVRRYGAAHAPLLMTGRKGEWQRNLAAFLRAHPGAIVGGDGNVRRMRRLSKRLGRPVVGREVMFLALPTGGTATVAAEQVRSSDHPIVRANVRDLPSKEKPVADYRFEKRPSPNHSSRQHYGYASKPVGITIHHWGAPGQTHDGVVQYLCREGGNTSAHEVISAGRVTQLVDHLRAAWHAGSTGGNGTTIGLECRPEMSDGDWQTLVQRCADIEEIHGSMRYYRHSDWKATACPGKYGPRLNELIKAVNAEHARRAGVPPVAPTPLPPTELSRTRARMREWRKKLGNRPRVRAAIDAFLKGTPKR